MDASIVTLMGSVALSVITGGTTVAVALVNSRKSRAEVQADLLLTEESLHRQLESINGMLVECEKRDAGRGKQVVELLRRVLELERKAENLRSGKPSDWAPLG